MKDDPEMTKEQIEDLLIEWNLYSKSQQEPILQEFLNVYQESYSQKDFLMFLRDKLQIDGYWKKIGIS